MRVGRDVEIVHVDEVVRFILEVADIADRLIALGDDAAGRRLLDAVDAVGILERDDQ